MVDESHPNERDNEFKLVFETVRKNLDKASQRASRAYNLRHRDGQFEVGQKVWRKNFVLSDESKYFSKKLSQ